MVQQLYIKEKIYARGPFLTGPAAGPTRGLSADRPRSTQAIGYPLARKRGWCGAVPTEPLADGAPACAQGAWGSVGYPKITSSGSIVWGVPHATHAGRWGQFVGGVGSVGGTPKRVSHGARADAPPRLHITTVYIYSIFFKLRKRRTTTPHYPAIGARHHPRSHPTPAPLHPRSKTCRNCNK